MQGYTDLTGAFTWLEVVLLCKALVSKAIPMFAGIDMTVLGER